MPEPVKMWGRNRPAEVSEVIKEWIADRQLAPGDRLPQEHELIEKLKVSKGTIREALKALETQGMIKTRTGPGGGAFIIESPDTRARALLANHFFYKSLSVEDICQLRITLEPALAAELAVSIEQKDIYDLEEKMHDFINAALSIEQNNVLCEEELKFHSHMAQLSKNPLNGFVCSFLVGMLKDLAVVQGRGPQMDIDAGVKEAAIAYQRDLIHSFKMHQPETAREVAERYMRISGVAMQKRDAVFKKSFLRL